MVIFVYVDIIPPMFFATRIKSPPPRSFLQRGYNPPKKFFQLGQNPSLRKFTPYKPFPANRNLSWSLGYNFLSTVQRLSCICNDLEDQQGPARASSENSDKIIQPQSDFGNCNCNCNAIEMNYTFKVMESNL